MLTFGSGIVRTLASICLSSVVGKWVDRSPNRLKTLLSTISVNRFSVISASVLWLFIVSPETSNGDGTLEGHDIGGLPISLIIKGGIFCLILALGILENLSASGNLLSMERDWVVTASASDGHPYDLTHLNSIMRRIDLICKLIAPILISVIVSVTNTRTGVLVVGSMSAASLGFEWWCAKRVWDFNPQLQAPKTVEEEPNLGGNNQAFQPQSFWSKTTVGFRGYRQDFKNYFSSTVWIPSLSLSFLHISALAYSATLITFLLNVGFSLDLITVARAAGSVVEIFSTVATPVGVHYLSKAKNHGRFRGQDMSSDGSILADDSTTVLLEGAPEEASGTETGLERLGLWGISWQLLNLVMFFPLLNIQTLMLYFIDASVICSMVLISIIQQNTLTTSPPSLPTPLANDHPTPPSIHPLHLPLALPSRPLDL
jgi:iron-regulated transporter 1